MIFNCLVYTPIGNITLISNENSLVGVKFGKFSNNKIPQIDVLKIASKQLREYFYYGRTNFSVPMRIEGTGFMLDVFEFLRRNVKFGQVISYKALAKAIGKRNAARAVGNIVSKNPIPIFIPCHRVILSSGKIGNYCSGNAIKKWLLEKEMEKYLKAVKSHFAM